MAKYSGKNIPEQKNIHQEDMAEDFQYEEKAAVFEWRIETDTKDILGYNCRKATTQYQGRKYTRMVRHGHSY